MNQSPSQIVLQGWLALFERGVAGWLDVVVACVEDAAVAGANATVAALPSELVIRLREERVIKSPPPFTAVFPIQKAAYPVLGTDSSNINRDQCLSAKLLHDYFYFYSSDTK